MTDHGDASTVERVFRQEYGRAVSVLARAFGDIDLAEEGVQEAFAVAAQRWATDGVPASPAGWIITTARHRIVDRLRREASREDRHAQAALLHAREERDEVEAVSGQRKVPVLVDGETVVIDSRQIVRYLYEQYGGERFARSAGELADDLDGELAETCELPARVAQ